MTHAAVKFSREILTNNSCWQ